MAHTVPQRISAVALALGTALFGLGSLLHPPTVRREDVIHVLSEGATQVWSLDHWLLAVATALMTTGLAGFHAALTHQSRNERGAAYFAAPLGVASATFWFGVFVFEASGWPVIAKAFAQVGLAPQGAGVQALAIAIAQALWSVSLGSGYAAGVLFAAAVALWSVTVLLRGDASTRALGLAGVTAGCVGVIAQPIAWAIPSIALPLVILAGALLGIWLAMVVFSLWRGTLHDPGGPRHPS